MSYNRHFSCAGAAYSCASTNGQISIQLLSTSLIFTTFPVNETYYFISNNSK